MFENFDSDLAKTDTLDADQAYLLKQYEAMAQESMSEQKRQQMLIQMKIAKKRAKIEGIEDVAQWITQTEANSKQSAEAAKKAQMLMAKKRLELLKAKKKEAATEQEPEDFEDKIAFFIAKTNKEELEMVAKVIEEGSYKKINEERETILGKLNEEKNIEKATTLRLALLGKNFTFILRLNSRN